MPPKRKPENRGLPRRWKHEHGAYYYRVPPGMEAHWDGKKTFRLGATLAEAHAAFAERVDRTGRITTVDEDVIARVESKREVQDILLDAMKRRG